MSNVNRGRYGVVFAALMTFGFGDAVHERSAEGVTRYGKGDFENSLGLFLGVERENPDLHQARFNSAAALYQLERYEEAIGAYHAASESEELAAGSLYGTGNCLAKLQKFPEALEAYKEAMRLDPDDEDIKHNFEMVRKMLEQQEQQQDEEQQDQDQEQQEQQQDQQENNQNQDEQEQDQEQQEQNEQEQEQDKQEQGEDENSAEGEHSQQEPPPEPQLQPGEMSEEDAERILQALEDEEEAQRKASLEKRRARQKSSGHDW